MGPEYVLCNGLWIRAYASTDATKGNFASLLPGKVDATLSWNPNVTTEDVYDAEKLKPYDAVMGESPPGEVSFTLKNHSAAKLALLHAQALTDITEDATQGYDYFRSGRKKAIVFYELWAYGMPVGGTYGMMFNWPMVRIESASELGLMGKQQPELPIKFFSYMDPNASTEDDHAAYIEDEAAPPAIVTSLSATSGAVASSVTITGYNFGSAVGSSVIYIGATPFVTPTWTSNTSLTGAIPAGASSGLITVKISGTKTGYAGVYFTVAES